MASGLFFGFGALCDGLVRRLKARYAPRAVVVATGGHAALIAEFVELARATASPEEALQDCLRRLEARRTHDDLATLREEIRVAQTTGAEHTVQRLLIEYQHRLSSEPKHAQHTEPLVTTRGRSHDGTTYGA